MCLVELFEPFQPVISAEYFLLHETLGRRLPAARTALTGVLNVALSFLDWRPPIACKSRDAFMTRKHSSTRHKCIPGSVGEEGKATCKKLYQQLRELMARLVTIICPDAGRAGGIWLCYEPLNGEAGSCCIRPINRCVGCSVELSALLRMLWHSASPRSREGSQP